MTMVDSGVHVAASLAGPDLAVEWLGRVAYTQALDMQRRMHAERVADQRPDTLLLLEHPHVFTLGRRSDPANIVVSEDFLRAQGATVEHNERGGEVTYHGPGQLVGYPIITLGLEERSLTNLVTRVEESILRTLAEFAIGGRREPTERGVWVGERKIASIGMAVRRWTTLHGMALNVDPDLRYFTYINPCGHPHLAMTSMALELGHAVDTSVVAAVFARHFATAFGRHAAATVQEHHGW